MGDSHSERGKGVSRGLTVKELVQELVEISTFILGFGFLGTVALNVWFHRPETFIEQMGLLVPLGLGASYTFWLSSERVSKMEQQAAYDACKDKAIAPPLHFLSAVGKPIESHKGRNEYQDYDHRQIERIGKDEGREEIGGGSYGKADYEREGITPEGHSRLHSVIASFSAIPRHLTARTSAAGLTEPVGGFW